MGEKERIVSLRPAIQRSFHILDTSHNNFISKEEVAQCHDQLPPEVLQIVSKDRLLDLIGALDMEDEGKITEEQFCEAIEQIARGRLSFSKLQQLRILDQI